MSMSEIKISTTMPANIIRQKLAVSSEVFLSLVCKNAGYFYIVAAKMLPIIIALAMLQTQNSNAIQSPF